MQSTQVGGQRRWLPQLSAIILSVINIQSGDENTVKIYLDVCCLNRPFDDQSQDRIRLEAEAVIIILTRVQNEDWVWYSSEVVLDEIDKMPDTRKRERVMQLSSHSTKVYHVAETDVIRARALFDLGFSSMDAFHLACAESSEVDTF